MHIVAGNSKVNLRVCQSGHGHADNSTLIIDHRSAGIAGMKAAIQLYLTNDPKFVLAQARHRGLVDCDVLTQLLAEWETEDEDLLGFLQVLRRRHHEWVGQVLALDTDHSQVRVGVNAEDLRRQCFLVLLAASHHDLDP